MCVSEVDIQLLQQKLPPFAALDEMADKKTKFITAIRLHSMRDVSYTLTSEQESADFSTLYSKMFSKELKSIFRDPKKTVVLFLIFVQNNKQEFLDMTKQKTLTEALVLGTQNFEQKRQSYFQRMNELEKRSPKTP